MKHFNRTVTVLVFIFLYIPMIVLGVASFNAGTSFGHHLQAWVSSSSMVRSYLSSFIFYISF